jgi:hypothetical protein
MFVLQLAMTWTALAQSAPVTQGVVLSAQAGASTCQIELRDARGERHQLAAAAGLCAPHLIGKLVDLRWDAAAGPPAACAKGAGCSKSGSAAIVSGMTPSWKVSSKDLGDGRTALVMESGTVRHTVEVPLGGCAVSPSKGTDGVFLRQDCSFRGQTGAFAARQDEASGLTISYELNEEEGRVSVVLHADATAQLSPGVLCRADEALYEGCALPDGAFFAVCTRADYADRFDTTPPYLVVRAGFQDVTVMEHVADAQHPIERRFTRHAGANTRHAFRWTHLGEQHMYESSYLDGNRLHALSSVVDGKLDVAPCSDHAPGQASLLTSEEFSTWGR